MVDLIDALRSGRKYFQIDPTTVRLRNAVQIAILAPTNMYVPGSGTAALAEPVAPEAATAVAPKFARHVLYSCGVPPFLRNTT
jgi:hypothetical protein